MKRMGWVAVSCIILLVLIGTIATAATGEARLGVWLWGATVRELGPDGAAVIAEQLADFGFDDVFLLVKGTAGTVGYASEVAVTNSSHQGTEFDVLQAMITEGHKRGLKIHAWYVVNSDAAFLAAYPDEGMFHYRRGLDGERVSPISISYRRYLQDLIAEVVKNYDIDGIHLDYVRYPHAVFGFSDTELSLAGEYGIDVEYIKQLIEATFYDPADNVTIFQALQNGDPEVIKWVEYRSKIITDLAQELKDVVAEAGADLVYSAALMPEGATDEVFAAIHYGQLYEPFGDIFDLVIPMAYWKDFGQEPSWVGTVTENTVRLVGNSKTYAGLQAYSILGSRSLEVAHQSALQNGADGIVLFRYGTFGLASIIRGNDLERNVTICNATSRLVDRVEIDFSHTGFTPVEAIDLPPDITVEIDGSKITLISSNLLPPGASVHCMIKLTAVEEDVVYVNPEIRLLSEQEVQVPVYVVGNLL